MQFVSTELPGTAAVLFKSLGLLWHFCWAMPWPQRGRIGLHNILLLACQVIQIDRRVPLTFPLVNRALVWVVAWNAVTSDDVLPGEVLAKCQKVQLPTHALTTCMPEQTPYTELKHQDVKKISERLFKRNQRPPVPPKAEAAPIHCPSCGAGARTSKLALQQTT